MATRSMKRTGSWGVSGAFWLVSLNALAAPVTASPQGRLEVVEPAPELCRPPFDVVRMTERASKDVVFARSCARTFINGRIRHLEETPEALAKLKAHAGLRPDFPLDLVLLKVWAKVGISQLPDPMIVRAVIQAGDEAQKLADIVLVRAAQRLGGKLMPQPAQPDRASPSPAVPQSESHGTSRPARPLAK